MAKEVQMSIKIERDLRDEFSRAAAAVHRPASQVMRELMRGFVNRANEPTREKPTSQEPNEETIAAIEEARRGEGSFATDVDDMFRQCGV